MIYSDTLPYSADATRLFRSLSGEAGAVLLHSADQVGSYGQFDIMSAMPQEHYRFDDGILHHGDVAIATDDPISTLVQRLPTLKDTLALPGVPFIGGFIGYFGFPLHQTLERQRAAPPDPVSTPILLGGWYDWAIVTDHGRSTTTLYSESLWRQRQVHALLNKTIAPEIPTLGVFKTSFAEPAYRQQFARVQEYICAGDTYQVNIARHYQANFEGRPFDLYEHWLPRQPAPFSAFLSLGVNSAAICFSPERFLQHHAGRLQTCPIKGTRPRLASFEADSLERDALIHSEKDRAENLMIVDLLRNDLGRICRTGSIEVSALCQLESFHNVHHLVSTIEGELCSGIHPLQALARLFPSGSVTGAPKIRALDIINELEPVGRNVYCGSIAYLSQCGHMDSNVAIRTAVCHENQVHLWGGGGLVHDSQVDQEIAEIENKIGSLLSP